MCALQFVAIRNKMIDNQWWAERKKIQRFRSISRQLNVLYRN
jgi:hypothetical protein